MVQVNPLDLIQKIKSGKNPQQLMISILEDGVSTNPIYGNLITLAKNNRTAEIEKFARNVYKERGLDFDKEFSAFKKQFFGR